MGVVISYHYMIIMLTQYYDFQLIFMIFGHTDFRKGVSGAKFDAESDFDVRLAVAPQKPNQNSEKIIYRSEKFADFFCSRVLLVRTSG